MEDKALKLIAPEWLPSKKEMINILLVDWLTGRSDVLVVWKQRLFLLTILLPLLFGWKCPPRAISIVLYQIKDAQVYFFIGEAFVCHGMV